MHQLRDQLRLDSLMGPAVAGSTGHRLHLLIGPAVTGSTNGTSCRWIH